MPKTQVIRFIDAKRNACIPKQVRFGGKQMGQMNSHSIVGGIRDVAETEVVVELAFDGIFYN